MRTIILGFALLVLVDIAAAQVTLTGRIVGIADGDTLTLLDAGKQQHRIRLDGIDAPETGQAFGNRSKQSLSDLAYAREAEAKCAKTDRFGRRVCKVIVAGLDVGLEQIRRGMAWHFKRYEREQSEADRTAYAAAEAEAKAAKRGLWTDVHPLAPWESRATRSM